VKLRYTLDFDKPRLIAAEQRRVRASFCATALPQAVIGAEASTTSILYTIPEAPLISACTQDNTNELDFARDGCSSAEMGAQFLVIFTKVYRLKQIRR
jgi:hypothetical protein